MTLRRALAVVSLLGVVSGCGGGRRQASATTTGERPSILLVTFDTTRADAMGPEASGVETPAFNAVAARGARFRQAYATVPETLPSHTSIMTGLYPAGHGIHENARYVPKSVPLLAERLHAAGYRTSAFVSSFALGPEFGLGRGFDRYDGAVGEALPERTSSATTDLALGDLSQPAAGPRFIWVHYYDPHAPYAPAEPFRSRFAANPYLGEVAAMDEQLGRLVHGFQQQVKGPVALVLVGDHGEGLGDHGEPQHGQLAYQSTMHVPLAIAGPGVSPAVRDEAVSTRRIYFTILDWAGLGADHSLRNTNDEIVLGEAMKPFLEYGWQPQVFAVSGRYKSILAGTLETYDIVADPAETQNLGSGVALPAGMRKALEDYPAPAPAAARAPETLNEDARRRLAALGYVSAGAAPVVRKNAPRPADMTPLFPVMQRASALFASGEYQKAVPVLTEILAKDPHNLDAALRLASSYSALGDARALDAFQRAATIAPGSQDVRTYLALHYARTPQWEKAVPLLEAVVAESPERRTAVDALAELKARQALSAMDRGDTAAAIAAFEHARQLAPAVFTRDLDLGVLYLAARRFEDARAALDRVLAAHPDDAMALFKRAQVSVLLKEADAPQRIALARQKADAVTKPLVERERLFQGVGGKR